MSEAQSPYEKTKRQAKRVYKRIGRVPCPALGGELVAFTSAGFNHMVRKGRIPRPKKDQQRRFALVPHIERIIRNPKATIAYERRETKTVVDRHGENITLKSTADFWTFMETTDDVVIKVVIRQLGERGQKHFFSVMGDRKSSAKNPGKKRSVKTKNPPPQEDL